MKHSLQNLSQPGATSLTRPRRNSPRSGGHDFHPTILREYDIRGEVDNTLFPEDAYAIGRAFGTLTMDHGGRRVAVGRDGRLSSPRLSWDLIEGLIDSGIEVLDIGECPTPMLYFSEHALDADSAVMVTGSHNPPTHNGFKMTFNKRPFFGQDIRRLAEMNADGWFASGIGGYEKVDIMDIYVDLLAVDAARSPGLNVAWDAGNGAAGEAMRRLVEKLPGRHILLNETIDGNFPNHHPDPTEPENLVQLQEAVRAHGCDLGVAFDGDGDRLGVVDRRGDILWGDQLLMILARDVLEAAPGATIIADVKASEALFDRIAALGGHPLMWKTGHSLIKTKMAETGAPLAGEMSGHIFFADRYFGYDDALYAAVRLLETLGKRGEDLAAVHDSLPKVINTPELRFDCADDVKFHTVEKVRAHLAKDGRVVNDIDGVRVSMENGWWLLRPSNTQPVLVARCEANSPACLEDMKTELIRYLAAQGVTIPTSF